MSPPMFFLDIFILFTLFSLHLSLDPQVSSQLQPDNHFQQILNSSASPFLGSESNKNLHNLSIIPPPMQLPDHSLFEVSFIGQWTNNNPSSSPFGFFKNSQGKILLSFNTQFQVKTHLVWYEPPADISLLPTNFSQYHFLIFDGQYHDDPFYFFELKDIIPQEINNSTQTIHISTALTTIQRETLCNSSITISLNNLISPENWQNFLITPSGTLDLHIKAPDCNLDLTAKLTKDSKDYATPKKSYDLFFRILMFTNSILSLRFFIKLYPFSLDSARIHYITPALLALLDLTNLINMYIPPNITPLYLLEICLLEVPACLLLMVPVLQFMKTLLDPNFPPELVAKKLCVLVLLPLLILFIFLIFSVAVFLTPQFLFIMSLIFIPQIIANAALGAPVTFDYVSYGFIIGLRPGFALYLKGFSENIFQVKSSIPLCFAIIISFGLQIYVLYLQSQKGPRFFIPKGLLRSSDYDYFRDGSIDSRVSLLQNNGIEMIKMTKTCKVCMEKLKGPPHHEDIIDEKAKAVLDRLGVRPEKIMKTECKHRFHAICLVEWMMVKMECPKCAAILKPLK